MFKNKNIIVAISLLFIILNELNATEYPSPPPVPAKFENAKEIQTYLGKLHNYYMIVGRPRLKQLFINYLIHFFLFKSFKRFGKRSFKNQAKSNSLKDSTENDNDVISENEKENRLLNEALELLKSWSNQLIIFLI